MPEQPIALVEERLDGIDIPTLPELGYDVTLTNWRALFAPPVVTEEEVAELEVLIAEAIATPEWKEPPAPWMAVVGFPSDGKSPALDPVLGVARRN